MPINITNGLTCEGEVDVSGHGAVLGLPELVVQPLDELAGQRHDDGLITLTLVLETKVYNHGEGPYLGLLLVESGYYTAFTFKNLLRHCA